MLNRFQKSAPSPFAILAGAILSLSAPAEVALPGAFIDTPPGETGIPDLPYGDRPAGEATSVSEEDRDGEGGCAKAARGGSTKGLAAATATCS